MVVQVVDVLQSQEWTVTVGAPWRLRWLVTGTKLDRQSRNLERLETLLGIAAAELVLQHRMTVDVASEAGALDLLTAVKRAVASLVRSKQKRKRR
jgi:hypothetical protein